MTTETFKLSRPLKTHNGELTELTLQEPTMRSFIAHGDPFKIKPAKVEEGEPERAEFVYDNNKALLGFLTDMVVQKGIDDIILSSITSSDFYRLRMLATPLILLGVQDKNFTKPSDA